MDKRALKKVILGQLAAELRMSVVIGAAPRTSGGNTDEDFIAAIDRAAMSAAPAQDTTKEKANG